MRTLKEMLEADKFRVKVPTMRFKDFCQYVYDPLMAANQANMAVKEKNQLIEDITLRLGNNINLTYCPQSGSPP